MNDNYEEIVRRWYNKLKPLFVNTLKKNFNNLSYDTIEDLYQESFIAVHKKVRSGEKLEGMKWGAYIMKAGMFLANKVKDSAEAKIMDSLDTKFDYDQSSGAISSHNVDKILYQLNQSRDSIYENNDIKTVLGKELQFMPEPCSTIIKLFYYDNMSMEEISVAINFKNATTTKSKKSQCMKSFVSRVKEALSKLGLN